jgi:hypothetical protein
MKSLAALIFIVSSLYGQMCVPARILPNGSAKGTLDETSCRLTDGSAYAAYRLDLAARGQIRIDLSTGSDLVLILRDRSGMKIESGTAIRRAIEAGSYTLLVNAREPGQTGEFAVQAQFTIEAGVICSVWPSLGLEQAADGTVGGSGCTLPDGTPYEGYQVTTFGAGMLTLSAAGDSAVSVIVRGTGGSAIASGTGEVSVPVDRDNSYQVLIHGDGARGAYRIATHFQPDEGETCRVSKTLAGPVRETGVVSLDSCTRALADSSDLVLYNYYALTVSAAGLADLQLSSSDFVPVLRLLDAGGNVLAADGSSIRMQLAPGNYTVEVASSIPSGGVYDLTYQLDVGGPQPCSATVEKAGDSIAGTLSPFTCRDNIGPADTYSLTLPVFGTLEIGMSSSEVVPRIAIRDSKDNLLVMNEDVQGAGQARARADLPGGSYYVLAAAASGAGSYQLTSQFTAKAAPSCSFVPKLEVNTAYVARLGSGSCVDGNGQPVDYFDFSLADDSVVAAVMTSTEVDGFLTILDSNGSVLRSDDNSYGFGDPLILQFLPAGSYRMAARAASSTEGGYYRLDLLAAAGPRPPLCAPRGTLAMNGTQDGRITFGSCQYPDATFADMYRFQLAADTNIDLLLTSGDFDAALILLDARGNTIDIDDDGGGGSNARITHMLAAGTYFVVAKAATDYTAAGGYTLALAQLP